MTDDRPRTTTIYQTEEDRILFERLLDQTGLSKSGLVRHLVKKEALGEDGSSTEKIRTHVSALAKIVL